MEVISGGYNGGFAPLRVGRQYNLMTVTVFSSVVSDTSDDYTWIFMTGTVAMLLTFFSAIIVALHRSKTNESSTTTTTAHKLVAGEDLADEYVYEEDRGYLSVRQPSRYDSSKGEDIEVVAHDRKKKKSKKKKRTKSSARHDEDTEEPSTSNGDFAYQ